MTPLDQTAQLAARPAHLAIGPTRPVPPVALPLSVSSTPFFSPSLLHFHAIASRARRTTIAGLRLRRQARRRGHRTRGSRPTA